MKYLGIIIIFLLAYADTGNAQQASMNIDLSRKLQQLEKSGNTDVILDVMVQGDLRKINDAIKSTKGKYKYGLKDMAAVSISAADISQLKRNPAVQRIEYYEMEAKILGDFLRSNNNLDSLHQGLGCLPQGLDGEGVIVATIDTGIDYRHPDFQNVDGTTRIKYLWDQLVSNVTNVPYGYGYEWTETDINDGSIQHNPSLGGNGHGTGVTGAAAGGGMAVPGKYTGAAPKADIIHVNLRNNSFPAAYVDAIQYIFEKADAEGKPCVINSSIGSYRGSHDTRPLYVQYIENLLDAKPGRVLVQAAGNGASVRQHLGYQVTADTVFSWFKRNAALGYVYYDLHADKANFDDVYFAFTCRDKTDYTYKGTTKFYNMSIDFPTLSSNTEVINTSLSHHITNENMGDIEIYAQLNQGVYDMAFVVYPTVTTDYWEFTTTGDGYFDVWSNATLMGTSSIEPPFLLPDATTFPDIVRYKAADTLKTIVSGINCSEKVISVANYSTSDSWLGYDGGTYYNETPGGTKVPDSSVGPTRDGVQKPDIAASGNYTAGPQYLERLTELQNTPADARRLAPEGWHATQWSGTSIAAPVVAGTVACYLQQFPNATYSEVKNALISTAKVDQHVLRDYGTAPNYGWGYGKLDGYNFVNEAVVAANQQSNTDLRINVHAWLEGAIDDSELPVITMHTDMNDRGLLPGQTPANPLVSPTPSIHPFTDAHWYYSGPESGFDNLDYQAIAAANGGNKVVDWVIFSLRDSLSASSSIFRKAAMILEDGKIVFPDNCAMIPTGQSYYIVIEHRLHMAAISHVPVSFSDNVLTYDFRTQNSYRTPTSEGQNEIYPGVWALYGGDGDQAFDTPGYDTNGRDKEIWVLQNGLFDLYSTGDYNMNGDVNGNDKIIWSRNNGRSSLTDKVND